MSQLRKLSVQKSIFFTGLVVIAVILGIYLKSAQNEEIKPQKSLRSVKIALTQIVPHPSLDLIRKGVEDRLKEAGISQNQIQFDNAMGSIATATQIAQKFASLKPDLIIALSTPSAQAAYSAAKENKIPVIYGAVSDPVNAKLIPAKDIPGSGVTGVSDFAPLTEQVALIKKMFPQITTLGVIYNAGEANSRVLVDQFKKECQQQGLKMIEATTSSSSEVSAAAKSLVGQVQAIYIPNDNTVVSGLPALIQVAQQAKIPVFASDPQSVESGCLAAIAPDQYAVGRQTAELALAVLSGQPISEIKPQVAKQVGLIINVGTADCLNVVLDKALKTKAKLVGNKCTDPKLTRKKSVGIVQVVEHPALDITRKGIVETLQTAGIADITWQSAQGNPALALQITQHLVGKGVGIIVTIGTMPSQIALKATEGTAIPVIYASVSDPGGAKLLADPTRATGVTNFVPIEDQLAFFKKLLNKPEGNPLVIGILYNPGEPNSVSLVEKTIACLQGRKDIILGFQTASKVSEVVQAAHILADTSDALFINSDNTALSAIDSIVKIATDNKIPVFTGDCDTIEKGVTAALGADQYTLGVQAAEMVLQVLLDGKELSKIPPQTPRRVEKRINEKMAALLGVKVDSL